MPTQPSAKPESFNSGCVESVYQLLHNAARNAHRRNPQATINTTALVNEAWLKLAQGQHQFEDELHYLKTAAVAMRQILVDHARYKSAARRDRNNEIELIETRMPDFGNEDPADWLALDTALNTLHELDPRAADVVMLRFFIGLSNEKTAEVLNVCARSSGRDWQRARAFLIRQLGK